MHQFDSQATESRDVSADHRKVANSATLTLGRCPLALQLSGTSVVPLELRKQTAIVQFLAGRLGSSTVGLTYLRVTGVSLCPAANGTGSSASLCLLPPARQVAHAAAITWYRAVRVTQSHSLCYPF